MFPRTTIFSKQIFRKFSNVHGNIHSLKSVIGLEVHAQISSESKLFSGSGTKFESSVNSSTSHFDAAIPGTLPVINRKCVESGVKTALALGCGINEVSMFDRKHYFYADLPAGYQITQSRAALANNGLITFPVFIPGKKIYQKTVRLLQLQLEQDSGKSMHDSIEKRSLIDLNRAGVPLMELVFAPELENGEEAASLVKELILILRQLKTCSCKMEEGALRVDANISLHEEGEPLGVRTEVKNIGSIRNVSQAICYEIHRQFEVLTKGHKVVNETRAWNAEKKQTVTMRDKEVFQDYRFMPEPNLPPLHLNMNDKIDCKLINVKQISRTIPELPQQLRQNLLEKYKMRQEDAITLVNEPRLFTYFTEIKKKLPETHTQSVINFLLNEVLAFCNNADISIDNCVLKEDDIAEIITHLHNKTINLQSSQRLIQMLYNDRDAKVSTLIRDNDLEQINDLNEIRKICKSAMENQGKAVNQYRQGKSKALSAIAGEVAKLSNKRANMTLVVKCLEEMLKAK